MPQVKVEYRHQIHRMLPELRKKGDYVYVGVKSYDVLKTYLKRYFKKIGTRFEVECVGLKARNPDRMKSPFVYQVTRGEDL